MKKLLSLLLVAMMLVGLLAGCGSEPAPASNPPAADGDASAPPAEDTPEVLIIPHFLVASKHHIPNFLIFLLFLYFFLIPSH